jgi:hypothetical protein
MKTLQTTQKRPYTSPFIEVLEAENDMKFLMASATINDPEHYATRQDFSETLESDEGFKE